MDAAKTLQQEKGSLMNLKTSQEIHIYIYKYTYIFYMYVYVYLSIEFKVNSRHLG